MANVQTANKADRQAVPMCDDFSVFSKAVAARFAEMSKKELFVTNVDTEKLYEKYLASFPAGTNPMRVTRTEHDCSTCRHFIRRLGYLVTITDRKLQTVWGDLDLPEPYKSVADALNEMVQAATVVSIFRSKELQFGLDHNFDLKTQVKYHHFCGGIQPAHRTDQVGKVVGQSMTDFQVAKRGATEIQASAVDYVLELIEANGLYRGAEHLATIRGFTQLMERYKAAGSSDLFIWETLRNRQWLIRNTVIGTLLTDLSEGMDSEQAVRAFEQKVAPANYKRPTSVITQRMVESAVQTLTDLGLHGAIARRYAKMSDVSVNDVLFVDNEVRSQLKDGVAALLEGHVKSSTPDLSTAAKISVDEFVRDVLPTAKTLGAYVSNSHLGNFVSLTGADGPERLFKWDNNFAWSYDGDVTDSVKQRVKAAGGKIDTLLRVSLSWFNYDDLDLHARTPDKGHIYFGDKQGILDVDMNAGGARSRNAVENLAFDRLQDGVYRISVNQYNRRETIDIGFALEMEFEGVVRHYTYSKSLKAGETVDCLAIHVKNRKVVKVDSELSSEPFSQEKWGIRTETIVPVAAAMFSPNYWGENRSGARHLILALKGCKNPDSARGVYNEFLRPDLETHRKVFEVLGAKTKCAPSEEQISGIGFTAARGDSVTVVVNGRRPYQITF